MFTIRSLRILISLIVFILFAKFMASAQKKNIAPEMAVHYRCSLILKVPSDSTLKKAPNKPRRGAKPYKPAPIAYFNMGWEVYKTARKEGLSNEDAVKAGNSVMLALLILRNHEIRDKQEPLNELTLVD